jgi:hypothetical protein
MTRTHLRRAPLLAIALAVALPLAACGKKDEEARTAELAPPIAGQPSPAPAGPRREQAPQPSDKLGFPEFATKNTTRIAGKDPTQDAAAVALSVFPAQFRTSRPLVVALVDSGNWQGGIAASVLMSAPLRAPLLLTDGEDMPDVTQTALDQLQPRGSELADNAQVIRIGKTAKPGGMKTTDIAGDDPIALARAIDRFKSAAAGKPSQNVVIVGADAPEYAMPAASWAAKSGDSVLFATKDTVPAPTVEALKEREKPNIYVLGPKDAVGPKAVAALRKLGTVRRVSGSDPVSNSVAFARFQDGDFGWGITDPGHGLVFAAAQRIMDAPAAAPLSSSGTYGPLLLLNQGQRLPSAVTSFLLDIQPGYQDDPVRGVYNRAWLIGGADAISVADQARIDTLLEIAPIQETPAS